MKQHYSTSLYVLSLITDTYHTFMSLTYSTALRYPASKSQCTFRCVPLCTMVSDNISPQCHMCAHARTSLVLIVLHCQALAMVSRYLSLSHTRHTCLDFCCSNCVTVPDSAVSWLQGMTMTIHTSEGTATC